MELLGEINGSEYWLSISQDNGYRLVMVTGTSEPKLIRTGTKFDCVSAFIDHGISK